MAVQEVFRRAFEDRARNAYNGINSFSNWVLAIARNMVINQFETEKSSSAPMSRRRFSGRLCAYRWRKFSSVWRRPIRRALSTPANHGEKTELRGLIQEFMSELAAEDKELLVLRFVENKSQEEAAEIIGSTRMKIRTAESKLRRRLKAFMRGTGYTDHMKGAD